MDHHIGADAAQDPRMSLKNILQDRESPASSSTDPSASPVLRRPGAHDGRTCARDYRRTSTGGSTADADAASNESQSSTTSEAPELWDIWQVRTSNSTYPPAGMERKPRAPRPSYSEEQKFYIMYCRVMCDQTWPEIEDSFSTVFGGRTKGGLTSIYYRVRKDWGLCEVLKSGPESIMDDHQAVITKASNFSHDFLKQIGYLDHQRRG